jgi:hypothetical protein
MQAVQKTAELAETGPGRARLPSLICGPDPSQPAIQFRLSSLADGDCARYRWPAGAAQVAGTGLTIIPIDRVPLHLAELSPATQDAGGSRARRNRKLAQRIVPTTFLSR